MGPPPDMMSVVMFSLFGGPLVSGYFSGRVTGGRHVVGLGLTFAPFVIMVAVCSGFMLGLFWLGILALYSAEAAIGYVIGVRVKSPRSGS